MPGRAGKNVAATSRRGRAAQPRWQLRDEATSQIRSLILSGGLASGAFVRLEPLAQDFGTSVTPIREAMMILREQGFVELHPNRGFVVCEFSPQDIQDLFLIQSMIGSELAARAAEHIDERALASIEAIQQELETLANGNGNGRAFELANDAFHAAVNECAGSPRLVWLYNAALPLPKYFSTIPGWLQMSIADHGSIIDALRRRDVEASRSAMASHVQHAGILLAEHLESEGRWPEEPNSGNSLNSAF